MINYAKGEPCTGVLFSIFVPTAELLLIMRNVVWSSENPLNPFESVKNLDAVLSPSLAHFLWHTLCTVALTNRRARQRVFPLYYLPLANFLSVTLSHPLSRQDLRFLPQVLRNLIPSNIFRGVPSVTTSFHSSAPLMLCSIHAFRCSYFVCT